MRRTLFCTALLLSLCVGVVCATGGGDPLAQADRAFCDATRARGLDGWMSWFAENASLPQMNPPVQGKTALRAFYQGLFSRKDLDFRWTPDRSELFPSGTLGYTSGRFTMKFTDAGGKPVQRTGSYLTVWEKQADGSWKVLADFGAPDTVPTATR